MRNLNSAAVVDNNQRLLDVLNAFIGEPAHPTGFTLKESVMNLLGGPDDAGDADYDYRDTCEALLHLAQDSKAALGHHHELALFFLGNAVRFFNDCISSDLLRAEIRRDIIEIWGCDEMTPAAVENLIKQYELKRQLAILEAEANKLQNKAA